MKRAFYLLAFLVMPLLVFGQAGSSARQRMEILAVRIATTERLLEKSGAELEASVAALELLGAQIADREAMIGAYNDEVLQINIQMEQARGAIAQLQGEIESQRAEYAALIVQASRYDHSHDKLLFILSAESFNQAYARMLYFSQLAEYRQRQAELLLRKRAELNAKLGGLALLSHQKERLMEERRQEAERLRQQRQRQETMQAELVRRVAELRRALEAQKAEAEGLDRAVVERIAEELRRMAEAAEQASASSAPLPSLPTSAAAGADFGEQRGRLPWPVQRGVVSGRFGVSEHPVLAGIFVANNGIDIRAEAGAQARAVFAGRVSDVVAVPGANKAILLAHGEFYTLYSNLSAVSVVKGQQVAPGHILGTIHAEPGDNSLLKFQVWHRQEKLDPLLWLAPVP